MANWKKFLFSVPRGTEGDNFVKAMTRLLYLYADKSGLEYIGLKAAMIFPSLMLMKLSRKSKIKDERSCLKRRLQLWEEGEIRQLRDEAEALQRRFIASTSRPKAQPTARQFGNLLRKGKVKDAVRLLKENTQKPLKGSDLVNGKTVVEILQEKHPDGRPLNPDVIQNESSHTDFHPIVFDGIDASLIRSSALKVKGSAGPSGLDAHQWRRLCTSFGHHSDDLCDTVAATTRRLCTEYVDPNAIESLNACRLIALNKNPGVRPIGVAETLRRIMGKAILSIISDDIQRAAGSVQLCAGQISGIEAAVHAMNIAIKDDEVEAAVLVDASNAFNNLNREAALRNIHKVCPALAVIATNTYRKTSSLFVDQQTVQSKEGTTQGDPLAMAIYAIAIRPLIDRVQNEAMQIWYADDAAAAGKLSDVKEWWDKLRILGPDFGYFPNALKSIVLTKPSHLEEAVKIFADSEVTITSDGTKYLGTPIGSETFMKASIEKKVAEWITEVEQLATIAKSEPQSAYAAFTHSTISEWSFYLRTVPVSVDQLSPLEDTIRLTFIPAFSGHYAISDKERDLLSLPTRLGGLGITDPITLREEIKRSRTISQVITQNIIKKDRTYVREMKENQLQARNELKTKKRKETKEKADQLSQTLDKPQKHAMILSQEKGASHWLNVLPIEEHRFSLHKGAFRDGLCLRYGWKPDGLPTTCVCGQHFDVDHALSCNRGGFPVIRHNELRDITADMLSQVCHNVSVEPHLQALSGEEMSYSTAIREDSARLDVKANGFFGDNFHTTYFDVRVFNPYAPSNKSCTPSTAYQKHERAKRRAYNQRITQIEHGSFSPLVFPSPEEWAETRQLSTGELQP